MSERKVLNKYYPPDFDPTKIPRSKIPRNDTFAIRVMAPFNMRCNNCGEYIYKGKKFNSRKETVQDEFYLGLRIFRFYIKCPRCVSEIAFKTDLENCDYALEAGATRNFEAQRTAELMAKKEMEEKEEEDKNNPMKVLENRTKASRDEMDMLETLEDLKEMNARNAKLDTETMVKKYRVYEQELKRLQVEEDEKFVNSIFSKSKDVSVKRIIDEDDFDNRSVKRKTKMDNPTNVLIEGTEEKRVNKTTKKNQLSLGIVRKNYRPNQNDSNSKSLNKQSLSGTITSSSIYTSGVTSNVEPRDTNYHKNTIDTTCSTNVEPIVSTHLGDNSSHGALGLIGTYSDSSESE